MVGFLRWGQLYNLLSWHPWMLGAVVWQYRQTFNSRSILILLRSFGYIWSLSVLWESTFYCKVYVASSFGLLVCECLTWCVRQRQWRYISFLFSTHQLMTPVKTSLTRSVSSAELWVCLGFYFLIVFRSVSVLCHQHHVCVCVVIFCCVSLESHKHIPAWCNCQITASDLALCTG